MPRPRSDFPKYQLHSSGQARVRLTDPDGRREDVLLGSHGSPESKSRYDQVVRDWVARGRTLPKDAERELRDLTNSELILAFLDAKLPKYDTRSSEGQVDNLKTASRYLRRLYGSEPARLMSPKRLKAIRSAMVADRLSRRFVNQLVSKIRSIYKWGVAEELIPGEVLHALASVRALESGEEGAVEKPKVGAVHPHLVAMTLPRLPAMPRDLVRLLMLTGARCGEMCILRPCDLDRSDAATWVFRPQRHKTQRKGKDRFVYLGPEARAVLEPWLEGVAPSEYVFAPGRAEELRNAGRGVARKTPKWKSHLDRNRRKRVANRKRKPSAHYTANSVTNCVRRACERIDAMLRRAIDPEDARQPKDVPKVERVFPHWHVHQLRHTAGTRMRREFGAEVAQLFLGHSQLSTTEIYAEPDREAVKRAVARLG